MISFRYVVLNLLRLFVMGALPPWIAVMEGLSKRQCHRSEKMLSPTQIYPRGAFFWHQESANFLSLTNSASMSSSEHIEGLAHIRRSVRRLQLSDRELFQSMEIVVSSTRSFSSPSKHHDQAGTESGAYDCSGTFATRACSSNTGSYRTSQGTHSQTGYVRGRPRGGLRVGQNLPPASYI